MPPATTTATYGASRLHYRRRRDRLVELLADTRPERHRSPGISAGLHVLLDVPGDADDMVDRAARQGLGLASTDNYHFAPTPATRQALIVGYGTPPDHSYQVPSTCSARS